MQSEYPLFRRFPNHLNMGTHWLEWTTRGADLFARPLNAEVEIVWCWPGQYHTALHTDREQRVLQAIQKEEGKRFWPLPSGEQLLFHRTSGFLYSPATMYVLRFNIHKGLFQRDVLTLDGEELRAAVAKLEEGDELQLARSLTPLAHQPWTWIEWIEGSREEFEPLLLGMLALLGSGDFNYWPSQIPAIVGLVAKRELELGG